MKNILIPTDFSDNTWNTIVYALRLFKHETCTFFLLHANKIPVSILSSMDNNLIESIKEKPKQDLLDLQEQIELADTTANHKFTTILKLQDLVTSIELVVNEHAIDFVIMGTKGATGAKEIFFGTNTMNVVNNMNACPILIVPETYNFVTPKEIAFASDFIRFYKGPEVHQLKVLSKLYNSKIRIVHICGEKEISDIQDFNKNELSGLLRNAEHSFHWMPDFSNKTEVINTFVEELDIHLLVMVKYKHSFLQKLLNEPVINKIGFQTKVPFLVIPDKK